MENRAGSYARFFASRGAKVVVNDAGCDVHGDGVDAAVENIDAAIISGENSLYKRIFEGM